MVSGRSTLLLHRRYVCSELLLISVSESASLILQTGAVFLNLLCLSAHLISRLICLDDHLCHLSCTILNMFEIQTWMTVYIELALSII